MNNIRSVSIQYLPTPEEVDSSKQLRAGRFLWPGFTHSYPVFGKEVYKGKYRYVTGLDLSVIPQDKHEEIEQVIKELEIYFGVGTLDPSNENFWKDRRIVLNKKTTFLDLTNPEDKLNYYIIKGGGIFEIAPSYEEANAGASQKRWYLIEPEHYADLEAKDDKSFNKAISKLVELEEEHTFDDMFLVHKMLVTSDRGVTKQTPKSAIYKDLSNFINGKIVKTDKRKTPKQFLEAADLLKKDKKKLYVTAYVKDASYFNFLTTAEDGQIQNIETRTKYGSSVEKAVSYLTNPTNQDELESIKDKVEKKWSE